MPNQQYTDYEIKGLNTLPNKFSKAPKGTLAQADNTIFSSDGLLEPRRGFDTGDTTTLGNIVSTANFEGSLTAFTNSGYVMPVGAAGAFGTPYTGTYTTTSSDVTLFTPRPATKNQSLFWASGSGVVKLESTASGSPIMLAGAPEPLLLYSVSNTTGSSGADWLSANSAVAYRVTLARYSSSGYLIESSPTARLIVTNTLGAASTPTVSVLLPPEIDAASGWFLRGYRTASADQTVVTDPGDECFQFYEVAITASHVTAGAVTILDTAPSVSYDSPLYTNANTGSGIASANDRPPIAAEVAAFKSYMMFANTNQKQSLEITILGTGAGGLGTGGFFEIFLPDAANNTHGPVPFRPSTVNDITTREFAVVTSGTVAQNIEATARNICLVVTQFFQPANKATIATGASPGSYYFSDYTYSLRASYAGDAQTPGRIVFEYINYGLPAFSIYLTPSQSGIFPPLGFAPGPSSSADPEVAKLCWSNDGLPEAVPLDNFAIVGDPGKAILRLVQLGQSLFIFKQNDGVWVLTGSDPTTFDIRQFDASVDLVSPNALAVLNGAIFCLTTRGVQVLTEAGVASTMPSDPIYRDILSLRLNNPNFDSKVFATSYETEGQFILACPAAQSDPACSLQYVYDFDCDVWTRWTLPRLTAGCVNEVDNKLYLGQQTKLLKERKTYSSADYSDDGAAITSTVLVNPISPAGPGLAQVFRDVYYSFAALEPTSVSSTLYTDRNSSRSTKSIASPAAAAFGWGNFAWGDTPWSAQSQNVTLQHGVPSTTANGNLLNVGFTVSSTQQFWQLAGVSLLWEPGSTAARS